MELKVQDIIMGVVVSGKAQRINSDQQKLVVRVHPKANKPQIKQAIEQLFDEVKVDAVRTIVRKGKRRIVRGRPVIGKLEKKAIVTLAEGYKVDMFGQSEVGTGVSDEQRSAETKES